MTVTVSSTNPQEPQTRSFEAGSVIFEEGELGTEMYIVLTGMVEILQRRGDEVSVLSVLEQGDFFGEMALLDDLPRSATARAAEKIELVAINRSTFVQMLRSNPEIAVRMIRKLSGRLRRADERLKRMQASPGGSSEPTAAVEAPPAPAPERLIFERTGQTFHLVEGTTMIGRKDPVTGVQPEVDLTGIDTERSSSRRHATLRRREGRELVLTEEVGAMNGTFVNDRRLETGAPTPVADGDRLRFGLVELVLRET